MISRNVELSSLAKIYERGRPLELVSQLESPSIHPLVNRTINNHRLIKKLEVFSGFNKIDHSERRFLNQFIYEIKKLDNSYFNIKLLLIVLFNLQKLLHRKKMFSALAKAFSQAIGVKLYRLMEILRHY